MMESDLYASDICRVCRSEGLPDRPLFHPCICTGSIKWIHQECLVQWMRYSRKEYCELCSHRFSFTPIYSPDMPGRLPLKDLAGGLLSSIATAVKYWLHFTLVAVAWLGIVPITSCRIYRSLFSSSFEFSLAEIISTENLASDIFHGCFIVTCTLFSFLGLLWLREQILLGGGPDWLERDNTQQLQPQEQELVDEPQDAENVNNNVAVPEEPNPVEEGQPDVEVVEGENANPQGEAFILSLCKVVHSLDEFRYTMFNRSEGKCDANIERHSPAIYTAQPRPRPRFYSSFMPLAGKKKQWFLLSVYDNNYDQSKCNLELLLAIRCRII